MRRREFLGSSPLFFLGARFACARPLWSQTAPKGPDLREELSTAEIEIVNKSAMAKDVDNFFGKGFS
jgi:hypothetical protein